MELRDVFRVLRMSWLALVVASLCGAGLGTAYSLTQTPLYESEVELFVSAQSATSISDLSQGSTYTQQAVRSFASVTGTPIVLDRVITGLGLDMDARELARRVEAEPLLDSSILVVTVRDESPERAAEIADAISSRLIGVVGELSPDTGGSSPVKVTVISEAVPADEPASPNLVLNVLIGLGAGAALAFAASLLRARLDQRIRGDADIESVTTAPIIGGIAFDRGARERPLIVHNDPLSTLAESFRTLRTNLQFLRVPRGPNAYVITSALSGEGKSTTVANLAITLAAAGESVVVVDADMRRPTIATLLGLEGAVGLSDVLIGEVSLDDALQTWGTGRVMVLPAGRTPPNPSELLQSGSMSSLLETLQARYQTVLIDAPPLLSVSDASVLARRVRGAIVVCSTTRSRRPHLAGVMRMLEQAGGRALGVVVTMLPARGGDFRHANTAYGYHSPADSARDKVVSRRQVPLV